MNRPQTSVTFACYNQIEYTRQCVASLLRTGFDLKRAVVIDNGSSDGTREYLDSLELGSVIYNRQNLGCGVAWNQGALVQQAEWTVVMNNDIVVSQGWLEKLIDAARDEGLGVVSPAMIEGDLDYDLETFAAESSRKMASVVRRGDRHAVCMAIHQSVWDRVGYFRATPSLWGFEDTLFFHELDKAGIATGIVGSSWIHHFGSVTLSALKRERGLRQNQGLSARDTYRLLGEPWWSRKLKKYRTRTQRQIWRDQELSQFAMTLHGERSEATFNWR